MEAPGGGWLHFLSRSLAVPFSADAAVAQHLIIKVPFSADAAVAQHLIIKADILLLVGFLMYLQFRLV